MTHQNEDVSAKITARRLLEDAKSYLKGTKDDILDAPLIAMVLTALAAIAVSGHVASKKKEQTIRGTTAQALEKLKKALLESDDTPESLARLKITLHEFLQDLDVRAGEGDVMSEFLGSVADRIRSAAKRIFPKTKFLP